MTSLDYVYLSADLVFIHSDILKAQIKLTDENSANWKYIMYTCKYLNFYSFFFFEIMKILQI